jgi:hypothetical protein
LQKVAEIRGCVQGVEAELRRTNAQTSLHSEHIRVLQANSANLSQTLAGKTNMEDSAVLEEVASKIVERLTQLETFIAEREEEHKTFQGNLVAAVDEVRCAVDQQLGGIDVQATLSEMQEKFKNMTEFTANTVSRLQHDVDTALTASGTAQAMCKQLATDAVRTSSSNAKKVLEAVTALEDKFQSTKLPTEADVLQLVSDATKRVQVCVRCWYYPLFTLGCITLGYALVSRRNKACRLNS